METCEVAFYETVPCATPMFETVGEKEMGESNFVEEEHEDGDWGDQEPMPLTVPAEPASTTTVDGPSTTTSTTLVPFEPLL